MLTGIHVAFIGGDARQLEVISRCIEMDAKVTLIGFNNLESLMVGAKRKSLTPDSIADVDALILPVVGTDDQGNIESLFSSDNLVLTDEVMAKLPKKATVYTGMAKSYLKNMCSKHQISLVELLEMDDVAIFNSIPTAEGALMMAIQNTDITIHGSRCVVLGLGRVGMTVARVLHAVGAKVRVGARKQEQIARIMEMGLEPFELKDLKRNVTDADLIFNTIPTMIVTAEIIAKIPHHCVIIDLASKPGGIDFRYAEKRGIKALLAPGLPGIVAPKTAGKIIAQTLIRLILEETGNQEG